MLGGASLQWRCECKLFLFSSNVVVNYTQHDVQGYAIECVEYLRAA
jgi:hypothetical protein